MKSKGAILVVDDTLASLKLLTEILTAEGYEIHPADSGELALASVASNPPEVILLDIRMPGMDGFEVCRRLKARPESREIPVLFISATTDQAERVEGLRLGAVDFIAKPFQREDLLARVAIHLELARLRTQLETQVAQRTAELTLANEQLKNELEERKRAEEALRASEERLNLATSAGNIGVWDWDIEKDVLTWGSSTNSLYGIRKEDFSGAYEAWSNALHPEDRAYAEGEIQAALRGERNYEPEFRIVRPDGTVRIIKAESKTIRDKNGKAVRMVGTNIDITERKRMEESIRGQAELLNITHDTIMVCDLDGTISFWNRGAEEMYGYSQEEATARNVHELLRTVFPQPLAEIEAILLRAGRWEGELLHTTQGGACIVVDSRQVLQRDKNNFPYRVLEINNDITERKRAEENLMAAKLSAERAKEAAEDASRAKDRFLAILSHELRTPLTPILALTSALREDKSLCEALHKDLQTIQRNVELEARLIDDLLDVTRIVHGKIKLDKRPVDLCEIIRRVVEICREDIKVRRIHFGVKTEGEPYPVLVDTARLQQVFWNLLKNALKFTSEDGCIGIECRRVGLSVVAEVKDSGKGIAAENLLRIFNPFEQIERRESGAYGGLGLGLSLSKLLVELHGGTIEAKSEGLEHGATFSVTLPLAEAVVPVVTSPAGPSAPASLRVLQILLVEDHGDTARILGRLLRNQGHEVRTAGDLKHALEMSRQWEFDLLISDLGLPDGNGRDLMSQLRSIRPTIPGIAISGFGTEEDIHLSLEAGFEEHLVKPVSIPALRAAIQRIASKAAI